MFDESFDLTSDQTDFKVVSALCFALVSTTTQICR